MRKKIVKTAIVAGLAGFLAGNAFWYLASPLWIDRVVSEGLPADFQVKMLAQGRFRDADSAHKGKGIATIFASSSGSAVLRFTEFSGTNGPDLKVWLVKAADPQSSDDVKQSEWISLGPLKGNRGDQTYIVPPDTNVDEYGSVVIWCEQFGVLFSPSPLAGV